MPCHSQDQGSSGYPAANPRAGEPGSMEGKSQTSNASIKPSLGLAHFYPTNSPKKVLNILHLHHLILKYVTETLFHDSPGIRRISPSSAPPVAAHFPGLRPGLQSLLVVPGPPPLLSHPAVVLRETNRHVPTLPPHLPKALDLWEPAPPSH